MNELDYFEQLQLVEVELKETKQKRSKIIEEYALLEIECDKILEKIKERKNKKSS